MAIEKKFMEDGIKKAQTNEYFKKTLKRANYGGMEINRTPMATQITVFAQKPGIVIGKGGVMIKSVTSKLEKAYDNPQIDVQGIDKPELNAQVVAYKLANLLESGWHFRRAGYNMLQNVVNAGAAGCETRISGKLTGPRSRSEKFSDGYIKHTGEIPEGLVSKGFAIAKCKSGVIGVKVSIIPPNIELPDDFHISVDSPKVNQISQREIGQHQGEVDGDTSSG